MTHVRVKRGNQTVFVYANPTETVGTIKERLVSMQGEPPSVDNIKLVHDGKILDEEAFLGNCWTEDSVVIHQVHMKEDGEWETANPECKDY